MIAEVILLFIVGYLFFTYIGYPMLVRFLASGKALSYDAYLLHEELPMIHIIIPLHNEEKVIGGKLKSILTSDYPADKLRIYVGLDNCTDSTNVILQNLDCPFLQILEFPERMGKPGVLNSIIDNIKEGDDLLVLTDADILFTPNTLFELAKFFRDERVGLVDSNIRVLETNNPEEKHYSGYETRLKHAESICFGKILGPSGGCYAIRRRDFTPIPPHFLVDDFFIGMEVVLKGRDALLNMDAICTEIKNTTWKEEYKRKIRIATGSFQNLWRYKGLLLYPFTSYPESVCRIFFWHKVMRWITPFLLIALYGFLLSMYPFVILIITFFLPVFVLVLRTLGLRLEPLNAFLYFISMNMAVLSGFFRALKGVRNNVWQPTPR